MYDPAACKGNVSSKELREEVSSGLLGCDGKTGDTLVEAELYMFQETFFFGFFICICIMWSKTLNVAGF